MILFLFFSSGKLCFRMACYFIWPFGKSLEKVIKYNAYFSNHGAIAKVALTCSLLCCSNKSFFCLFQAGHAVKRSIARPPKCEVIPEEGDTEDSKDLVRNKDSAPLLMSSPIPIEIPVPEPLARKTLQCRISTYVWLLLGYPVLAVVHSLACVLAWMLVFTIPVSKMNARTMTTVLLMAPEDIQIHRLGKVHSHSFSVGQSKECVQYLPPFSGLVMLFFCFLFFFSLYPIGFLWPPN